MLTRCPPVVGKKIASPILNSTVNEVTEICGGFFQSVFAVHNMQVKDDADIRFLGPSHEALIVPFDQTERAEDNLYIILTEIFANILQKMVEGVPALQSISGKIPPCKNLPLEGFFR